MTLPNKPTRSILYAELLSNIRQVSIAATLPSLPKPDTVASIAENGQHLYLEHDGHTERLDLPGTVAKTILRPAHNASRHITWRLPLASGVAMPPFSPENQAVPWSAMDLETNSTVSCRMCSNQIIPRGTIKSWKDLPSENWAEMMEFWHCHKPHDHGQEDNQSLANKGYGANNIISSQLGVGFVDVTSFMFDEHDCQNLLFSVSTVAEASSSSAGAVSNSTAGKYLHLFCSKCTTEIGLFSLRAGSVTLFKWQVLCNTAVPINQAPNGSECLAASLIANISRSGCAKSLISPHISENGHGSDKTLYLWVLNPNVVYSSSSIQGKRTGMKILFQEVTREEGNKLLDSIISDVQDLYLPVSTIQSAKEALLLNGQLLPETERFFKEWQVGLLDRWGTEK